MNWTDQPASQPPDAFPGTTGRSVETPTASPTSDRRSPLPSLKRTAATALLAVGLLGVGGAAVVFAADPGTSPAPSATAPSTGGSGGTTQPAAPGTGAAPNGQAPGHGRGNCPNKGDAGSGSQGSSAPSTPSNGTTPSTSDL